MYIQTKPIVSFLNTMNAIKSISEYFITKHKGFYLNTYFEIEHNCNHVIFDTLSYYFVVFVCFIFRCCILCTNKIKTNISYLMSNNI